MREREVALSSQWHTRPGREPRVHIYLATGGGWWRVHANREREVLLRQYYRDRAVALAAVAAIITAEGGPDEWLRRGPDKTSAEYI